MVNSEQECPAIRKAPARVLGYDVLNYLRVAVLTGVGMVDGGVEHGIQSVSHVGHEPVF
ncbi:hypothetical protein [Novipirellula sp.]|uniref:hypothetical protein n=1 Tax=Novipirellula sp. TaxID=2795430 RepID=UPI003563B32B